MPTNLTIDDSYPDISFSSNWATQFNNDQNTGSFFQSTYHAAQMDGATANISFTGLAIYLYGSKGPGHANYSVQFDDFIMFLSAEASDTMYQQPLFGFTFNSSGNHFVSLTAHFVPDGNWLDLDFITITTNDTESETSSSSSSQVPVSSISPPWLSSSSFEFPTSPPSLHSTASTSQPTPFSAVESANSSPTNRLTLILSILFGTIIAIALLMMLAFCLLKKYRATGTRQHGTSLHYEKGSPNSAQSSPALLLPGQSAFSSPATTDYLQSDPYAHSPPTPDFDHDISRPKSPWSSHSHAATMLTQGSATYLLHSKEHSDLLPPSQAPLTLPVHSDPNKRSRRVHTKQASSTSNLLLNRPMLQTHSSPILMRPLEQDGLGAISTPNYISSSTSLPVKQHRQNYSQTSLLGPPLPTIPRRPKRPGDGLLDWLGNGIGIDLSLSEKERRRRDDSNSQRTNFLQV